MESTISLTAAALATQVVLLAIVFVATLSTTQDAWYTSRPRARPWNVFAVYSLSSIAPVAFSSEIVGASGNMIGAVEFAGIALSTSMLAVFLINIVFVGYLTLLTGGTRHSHFTPVLLTLPALSIFLRLTFQQIGLYVFLISVALALGFAAEARRDEESSSGASYWFIAVACLILTTGVGYVTRPATQ